MHAARPRRARARRGCIRSILGAPWAFFTRLAAMVPGLDVSEASYLAQVSIFAEMGLLGIWAGFGMLSFPAYFQSLITGIIVLVIVILFGLITKWTLLLPFLAGLGYGCLLRGLNMFILVEGLHLVLFQIGLGILANVILYLLLHGRTQSILRIALVVIIGGWLILQVPVWSLLIHGFGIAILIQSVVFLELRRKGDTIQAGADGLLAFIGPLALAMRR